MWVAGHDVWAPTYLSRCLEVLESDATLVACNSLTQLMSQDGKDLGRSLRQLDTRRHGVFVRANLALWQVSPFIGYSLIRAGILRQNRLVWRPVVGPDHLLGLELSLLGPTAIVPEPLFFLRDNRADWAQPGNRSRKFAALLERLYPGRTTSARRFWQVRALREEMRAVKRARLSLGQRIALWVSIPPTYFLRFYPFVPAIVRGAVRRLIASVADRKFAAR
jgi:hypothetical protein